MILYIIVVGMFSFIILYLLAIMPRMMNRADREPFIGKYYAHRGIHDNKSAAPENTIPAFLQAVQEGYGIELDVQLTKDGELVVFHDYSLERACAVKKKVADLTFEELEELQLFHSEEKIPKLEEVLSLVDGKVPLIIELKVEWSPTLTCQKTADLLKEYKGDYCIESFSPLALIWYKKNYPEVLRGQLSTNFFKDKEKGDKKINFLLQNLLLNFLAKPDFIAYNYRYRNMLSFVLCHRLFGALAFAWTIQSEKALEISQSSFDGFIFDSFSPKLCKKRTSKN